MAEPSNTTRERADRWDWLVKGAAGGAAVVLVIFLVIFGIVYFTSDYDFATAAPAPSEGTSSGGEAVVDSALAAEGFTIATGFGCLGCHSTDGSRIVGPTWSGLFGSSRTFGDGSTAIADAEYITRSIKTPNAQVVDGFNPDIMPSNFADRLTAEDIEAIIAYMKSLG